jgi:hypothetical protein
VIKRSFDDHKDFSKDEEVPLIVKCNITDRYEKEYEYDLFTDDGDKITHMYLYEIEIKTKKSVGEETPFHEHHIITDVPWNAIRFYEKPYTSDVFLKHAFRHEMKLPDEIFPKAWMNLGEEQKKNSTGWSLW